jgi:hypothetical protein
MFLCCVTHKWRLKQHADAISTVAVYNVTNTTWVENSITWNNNLRATTILAYNKLAGTANHITSGYNRRLWLQEVWD